MPDGKSGFCFLYSVQKTEDKGMGVFAQEAITKGSIVWRHIPGLYTVYDEASFKSKIEKLSHADVVYELTHIFGLSDFPDCLIRVFDDGVLINHSDSPNLATNNAAPAELSLDPNSDRYLDNVTETLLDDRYAMVATRDIEKGEEFSNDYNAECDEPPFFDKLYEQYGVEEDYLNDG
jgi:SET domain-containing protein